jgi:hypothetical protein
MIAARPYCPVVCRGVGFPTRVVEAVVVHYRNSSTFH